MAILPSRLLQLSTSVVYDNDYWYDSTNPTMWDGTAYRWNVVGTISPQFHSSDQTPNAFTYNGTDIKAGDWATDSTGRLFEIVEISDPSDGNFTCVFEDVDRFNLYNDPFMSGYGGPQSSICFVFKIAENGLPDLGTIPAGYMSAEVLASIESRFAGRDYKNNFVRVYQSNNNLAIGDFITVDVENEGRFIPADVENLNFAVGIVNSVNVPGTDWFTFKPLTEILNDVQPPLVGAYGDIFYIDPVNPGKVTNVKPASDAKPVYIRLETENRAVRLNAIVDENSITVSFKVETITLDQTAFTLPGEAKSVQAMSINGIENKNFTFDALTKVITFDPVATGYGVEETDEVIFVYNT